MHPAGYWITTGIINNSDWAVVPCRTITTMSGARASVEAVASRLNDPIRVWSLQEIHEESNFTSPAPVTT